MKTVFLFGDSHSALTSVPPQLLLPFTKISNMFTSNYICRRILKYPILCLILKMLNNQLSTYFFFHSDSQNVAEIISL